MKIKLINQMKLNKYLIFSVITFLFISCNSHERTLKRTLNYSHSVEATDEIYNLICDKVNLDSIYNIYNNKAIVIDFELKDSVITNANETIYEFGIFGNGKYYSSHKTNKIAKYINGINVSKFKIVEEYDAPGYDFVIDFNKLYNLQKSK